MNKKKKFIFEADPELHRRVKMCAAVKNMSMTLYITRAVLKKLSEDEKQYEQ